jgi:hypothetical protein
MLFHPFVALPAKREFNAREEVTSGQVPPFEYCLIVCAMRMFLSDFSAYYKVLSSFHMDHHSILTYFRHRHREN